MQQRIGHLVPSTSCGTERWMTQICSPLGVETAHPVARAALPEYLYGPALAPSQSAELTRAAYLLAHAGADAVVWNGSSADLHGAAHARAAARRIEETTGVRASTVTLGTLELLAHRGLTSVALVTPGSPQLVGRLADTFLGEGFKVTSTTALGLATPREAAELPVGQLRRMLREADPHDADCLVVTGTELPVAPVAALVERELGKPVFDGARVAVKTGLALLGLRLHAPQWGELFAQAHHEAACCAQ
ncbi:maleate cis-trans isomerase family protein [Streptomyces sp. H27-D2]|uniref:maleate cis-trans isomerase family protein n=1 Tax=Streptomyces sp. H27-D2 TaxID=3046304 RepID=UPI002DBDCBF7|nr:hypothetical protein [Streptomyces sp. H27-D2]MEC4020793.1 hypothetical protein [Streptomyces sp. H27-D2]